MTITKDIEGLKMGNTIEPKTITVRITRDCKGKKSLSLADEKSNIMLMIPLEPIEHDLKRIVR